MPQCQSGAVALFKERLGTLFAQNKTINRKTGFVFTVSVYKSESK